MNHWAQMLAEAPAECQRLIARSQRISLPRTCDAATRVLRLRQALCHAATVRAMYQLLEPEEQSALQHLRTCHGGLSQAELVARFGSLRSWRQIAADRAPQSITERLVLMGWLLPRPGAPFHPPRFALAPELRRWLPRPLALPSCGAAPPPPLSPVLHAATALLLACVHEPARLGAPNPPPTGT